MSRDLKQSGSAGSKSRMQKMVKTRQESSGYKWVDNPTKDHTMDRYEGTMYMKDDQYQGGLLKLTDQNTSKETYTKYKPNKKAGLPAKAKDISEKRYNRIKKRKSKKFKQI